MASDVRLFSNCTSKSISSKSVSVTNWNHIPGRAQLRAVHAYFLLLIMDNQLSCSLSLLVQIFSPTQADPPARMTLLGMGYVLVMSHVIRILLHVTVRNTMEKLDTSVRHLLESYTKGNAVRKYSYSVITGHNPMQWDFYLVNISLSLSAIDHTLWSGVVLSGHAYWSNGV